MRIAFCVFALFVSVSLFFSCNDDEKFSSDNNIRLTFSSDTVRFDTVFTGFGTATKKFKIYNNDKRAISISNIELVNADKSGFRMNVDGESGNKISNIDILGKDSIFVLVEAHINPLDQNSPLLVSDSIRIQFNGVTQYVQLEAIGQDVVLFDNKEIDQNTTLTADKPYLVYNSLSVSKDVVLTIEKDARLYFHKSAKLVLNGTINAKGTIDQPIVMRGDRTDNMFESPVLPYDRVPGQWQGIFVGADSYNNVFENVRIRNGVYGIVFEASDPLIPKATFFNAIIQNTTKEGLWAMNCNIVMKNSLVANSSSYAVRLLGGDYELIHCTIANYMYGAFVSIRRPAMLIGNTGSDINGKSQDFPLSKCLVANTIVAGSLIEGNIVFDKKEAILFNHSFVNCLLKAKGTDDDDFINTLWGVDPLFKFIYSSETASDNLDKAYYYNYELTESSPAIEKASMVYSSGLREDIRGVARRINKASDIGCYEFEK